MRRPLATQPNKDASPPATLAFYRNVLQTLNAAGVPYLVGGSYALIHYTGVNRRTKDFDIFIAREDFDAVSHALAQSGYTTELTHPHWLGKVRAGGDVIDLVFSSGNGVAKVDSAWFDNAVPAEIFDVQTQLCPPEEILWSKAYIMERERFDGADIAHLLRALGGTLDWSRLLERFGPHWRLLLSHLTLFGFIYPAQRDLVPAWVMNQLIDALKSEVNTSPPDTAVCSGTLLSREQYLSDIDDGGYSDARLRPQGNMTAQDTAHWTAAINNRRH